MSNLTLSNSGELSILLSSSVELSPDQKQKLQELEQQYSMLSHAEDKLKSEVRMTTIKLMNNPDFIAKMKLEAKIKVAREMQRKAKVLLDAEYNEIFRSNDILPAEYYANSIPDGKIKGTGKRGRPRLTGGINE